MDRFGEMMNLLTSDGATFPGDIAELRVKVGVPEGGFKSDKEMEEWLSRKDDLDLKTSSEMQGILMLQYRLSDSYTDSVAEYLYFNRVKPPKTDVTVLFSKDPGELYISVHGDSTREDILTAWKAIENAHLRRYLPDYKRDKFKPIKDFELQKKCWALKQEGLKQKQIGEKLGISYPEVQVAIRDYKRNIGIEKKTHKI